MPNFTVESVERRCLLSISLNSDGWTDITPAADTRVIYVSSSTGSDTNDGLSPNDPVQSIGKGASLLRNGSADWMLLKCGDTWNSGIGTWRKSGRSNNEPMVIGSYGSGSRPLLDTGTSPGFWAAASSNPEIDHIAIMGLHFDADGRDPASPNYMGPTNTTGIDILTKTNGILIENCQIENYAVNINLQSYFGPITNASVRRNVIDDAYATTTHSQGLYCYGVSNLLIAGNVFDANGYNTQVTGGGATYYNHDCYLASNNVGVVVTDNIFARAAGYGLQARAGGIVEDNLFIDDPVGMSFGLVNGATSTSGGVTGIVNGNVFIGGGDLNGAPFGQGLVLGNTQPGYPTVVSNNIFTDSLPHAPAAITLTYGFAQTDPQGSVGLNDLDLEGNVLDNWYRGVLIDSGFQPGGAGLKALNDVTIQQNEFQNIAGSPLQISDAGDLSQVQWSDNIYSPNLAGVVMGQKTKVLDAWVTQNESASKLADVPYADSTRSIATYDSLLGGTGTDQDFLMGARQLSRQNWPSQYAAQTVIAWMQAGYQDPANPHDWSAPTPPIVNSVAMPTTVMARNTLLTFTVSYLGDKPIDLSSLSSSNLVVSARGYSATAQFLGATGAGDLVTAIYTVPAPRGAFRVGGGFNMKLKLNTNQVKDSEGFSAMGGSLGTFPIHITPRPKPPRVQRVGFSKNGSDILVQFSSDVSASLRVSDLVLQSDDGQNVQPSLMTLSWDSKHRIAIWSFSGEPGAVLPPGRWHMSLLGETIADTIGQFLAGNRGEDFYLKRPLVLK